jgi:hypothetical protein
MPGRSARGLTAVLSHVDEHRFNTNTVSRETAHQTGGVRCKLEDVTMSRLRGKPLGYSLRVIIKAAKTSL